MLSLKKIINKYFFNNFSNLNMENMFGWLYIHRAKHTKSKTLRATQSMKWFAFARCQLHLNERSGIICDYKHWSSFGELSAVTLTTFIRLQMRTSYFNLSGSDFFFLFITPLMEEITSSSEATQEGKKRSPDIWCNHNNQNNMLRKESLRVLSQCI